MKRAEFISQEAGTLVPTIEGCEAFVPASLPPKYNLAKVAISVGGALQALGELKGACRRLQNPYMLVRPLQRNEALTSSAMEGTFTTDSHLLLAEAGLESDSDESTREVVNYLRALGNSLNMLKEIPISHRVIKKAHEILLSGLSVGRGARKRPGEYKREQNWIGGRTIDVARFIPPPPDETLRCMDDLEAYINRDGDLSSTEKLIDLALVHYQIEAIHPFADGNGRVGRMLISLMAVHNGLLDVPILYISPVMERYKDDYIDNMFNVSAKGAWEDWIIFFSNKICESCIETIAAIDRILNLQQDYRTLVQSKSKSSNPLIIIDHLFESPVISVTEAARILGVTYPAAKGTIDKLIELGVLREMDGVYPKAFYAPAIIRASRTERSNDSAIK